MSREHRKRIERERLLLAEPETLGNLCDHIASGGTLADFCRKHDVRYRIVKAWIEEDANRAAAFTQAEATRKDALSDEVLDGVVSIVRQDSRKLYGKDGQALPVSELPDELAGNITGLKTESVSHTDPKTGEKSVETVVSEVKMISRQAGLEMLGKITGALGAERLELTGAGGGPIQMATVQANLGKLSTAELKAFIGIMSKLASPAEAPKSNLPAPAKVLKLPAKPVTRKSA